MRCLPGWLRAPLALVALLVLGLSASTAVAVEVVPSTEEDSKRSPGDQSAAIPASSPVDNAVHLNIIDQRLAVSLAVELWGQIEASEAVLPSVRSATLKQELLTRVAAQRELLARLEALTGGRCSAAIHQALGEIEADAKRDPSKPVRFRPLALNKNATGIVVRIRVEILQQYTEQVNQYLATPASEFDRNFARADVLHQMQVLSMLHVFAAQASDDFAAVIRQAAETAAGHLAQSRLVLEQLETPSLAGQAAELPAVPLAGATTAVLAP